VTPGLTWLGHSTVLVELGGARLLTDPVLRSRIFHLRRDGTAPRPPESVDAVLVSHLHFDHLDLPSLRMLKPQPRLVCPTGSGALLARAGFADPIELLPGESVALGGVRVTATPAEHGGARRPGGPVVRALGFVLSGDRSIYFAGDTDLFDGMRELGPVDVALLPIWGWGPTVGAGHLDPQSAAEALTLLRPSCAIPIHWGTYHVLGARDVGRAPADAFAVAALQVAPEVDVRIIPVGGSLEL
jgi:L-ascorbate metabolism protein UlaG (beta-lactamase superfamily)